MVRGMAKMGRDTRRHQRRRAGINNAADLRGLARTCGYLRGLRGFVEKVYLDYTRDLRELAGTCGDFRGLAGICGDLRICELVNPQSLELNYSAPNLG